MDFDHAKIVPIGRTRNENHSQLIDKKIPGLAGDRGLSAQVRESLHGFKDFADLV